MSNDTLSEYYDLVSDAADLLRDGFKRSRQKPANLYPPGEARTVSATGTPNDVVGSDMRDSAIGNADATSPRSSDEPMHAASSKASHATVRSREASTRIDSVADEVAACRKCPLAMGRTHPVPGEGSVQPIVLVVGEGPGAEEDRTGRPFVGPAGRYLDKWLEAIGLSRHTNCFIANVVKCRPPNNRDPKSDEVESCLPHLEAQIDALGPSAILTVGRIAIQNLLHASGGIGAMRGKTYQYRGVPVVPTYHPSGVLRNPGYRKPVWDDLRILKEIIEPVIESIRQPSDARSDG